MHHVLPLRRLGAVRAAVVAPMVAACCLLLPSPARAQESAIPDNGLSQTPGAVAAIPVPMRARRSGGLPPGLLRYALPARGHQAFGPFLAVGTVLLLTDRQTLASFDPDPLEKGGGGPDPLFRDLNFMADGRTLGVSLLGLYTFGTGMGRDTAKVGAVAFVNAAVATGLLKGLVGKERPDESGGTIRYHGPSTSHASFPSGHTAAATAIACVLAHDYPQQRWLWYGLAGAVAVSRISSGEHFASDVFFGAGVGIVSAEGAIRHRDSILAWRF